MGDISVALVIPGVWILWMAVGTLIVQKTGLLRRWEQGRSKQIVKFHSNLEMPSPKTSPKDEVSLDKLVVTQYDDLMDGMTLQSA